MKPSFLQALTTGIYVIIIILLMRFMIYEPMLEINGFAPRLPIYLLALLISAIVLVAMGISLIYDPLNNQFSISGKSINLYLYAIFSLAGIILALFVSLRSGLTNYSSFFVIIAGLVWFAANYLSRVSVFWHQLLKSFLLAIVPVIPSAYEIPLLNQYYASVLAGHDFNFNFLIAWSAAFGAYIFLISLLMSIYDHKNLVNSLRKNTLLERGLAVIIITILVFSLFFLYSNFLKDSLSLVYFLFILILNILAIAIGWKDVEGRKKRVVKTLFYLSLLAGISYALWVPYILKQQFIQ